MRFDPTHPVFELPPACESWGSYCNFEDLWNIDMEGWVVANEQKLLEMIWNGNLTVSLCVELKVLFLSFLTISFDWKFTLEL